MIGRLAGVVVLAVGLAACSLSVTTQTKGQLGRAPAASAAAVKAVEAYEAQLGAYCTGGQVSAVECMGLWDRLLALIDAEPEARAARLAALDVQTNAIANRPAREQLRRRLAEIRKQLR